MKINFEKCQFESWSWPLKTFQNMCIKDWKKHLVSVYVFYSNKYFEQNTILMSCYEVKIFTSDRFTWT